MPTKTWTCQHLGHEIKIENYWNLLLWGRERLYIDGELADEQQGWGLVEPRYSVDLSGWLEQPDGSRHEVKARLSQGWCGLVIVGKIWVNGKLIFPRGR